MSLRIYAFEVGHGDCLLVETITNEGSVWMAVDCNTRPRGTDRVVPSAEFLKKRGVTQIDTLVITHFHRDHYAGVEQLLRFNPTRVFVPPFVRKSDKKHTKLLEKPAKQIREIVASNDDPNIVQPTRSLAHLFKFISDNDPKLGVLREATGPGNRYRLSTTPLVEFDVLLPLPRVRGVLHARLSSESFGLDAFAGHNEASIAVALSFAGVTTILAGDSECAPWREHQDQRKRDRILSLDATVLKVSHHGSRENNAAATLDYLLGPSQGNKVALCSADGVSHPHKEYFAQVGRKDLHPYCTCLARECDQNLVRLPVTVGYSSEVTDVLDNYAQPRSIPCQGDIVITIDDTGSITVGATNALACPYRPINPAQKIAPLF